MDTINFKNSFIEFRNSKCLYNDCSHIKESSEICDVKRRVDSGEILNSRYENYIAFITTDRRF